MRARVAIVLSVLSAAACGGAASPTSPSLPRAANAIASTLPPVGAANVEGSIDWRCVSRQSTVWGIFAAAADSVGCRTSAPTTGARLATSAGHVTPNDCVTCGAPSAPIVGPSNLTAAVTGTTVTLVWGGIIATSYVVEAGSAPGLTDLAAIDVGNPPRAPETVTFTDVPSGIYYVRVRAFLAGVGLTQPSNEVLVIVGNACGVPGSPTGLSASVAGSTVSLVWAAAPAGCAADHYIVQAGSAPGASDLANLSTGSAVPSFSASGVGNGVYYVRVRAANGSFISGPSNEAIVTVGSACPVPASPSGLTAAVSGSSVSLTWSAPAACAPTSYVVQAGSATGLSDLANFSTGSAIPAFAAAGVGSGTYYVRVRAVYGGVTSAPSNEVIVTIAGTAPSFAGTWHGGYNITDCRDITPGLPPLNLCAALPPSSIFQLVLTQNGVVVSGTYTQVTPLFPCACGGNYGTFDVTGTVAADGTLELSGSGPIPATGLTATIVLRVREPNPLTMDGTIAANLTFGGLLRGTFAGTLVSVARQ